MSQLPNHSPDDHEARAKTRFFILAGLRFSGALLVMFGILVFSDRIDFIPRDGRMMLGLILFFAGMVEALWIPQTLAHKWRSPDR